MGFSRLRLGLVFVCLMAIAHPARADSPYERLRAAIEADRTDELAALLKGSGDPDSLTGERTPLLVVAVGARRPEAVELLLAHGADVDAVAPGMYGATSLMIAAGNDDRALVVRLLEAGANVNARDANGDSALNWVAYYGFEELTAQLLAAGADQSVTGHGNAVEIAMRRGHQGTVRVLLSRAGKLRTLTAAETLLRASIERDDAAGIRKALGDGAPANGTDETGRPWIAAAARAGALAALDTLLSAGADVDAADQIGFTALMEAARDRRDPSVERLLAAGANPKARAGTNGLAMTPLHLAAIGGSDRAIELLAGKGADLNAGDRLGTTPMLWALYDSQVDAALVLFRLGADPRKANEQGDSPQTFAEQNQVERLLKAFGKR